MYKKLKLQASVGDTSALPFLYQRGDEVKLSELCRHLQCSRSGRISLGLSIMGRNMVKLQQKLAEHSKRNYTRIACFSSSGILPLAPSYRYNIKTYLPRFLEKEQTSHTDEERKL